MAGDMKDQLKKFAEKTGMKLDETPAPPQENRPLYQPRPAQPTQAREQTQRPPAASTTSAHSPSSQAKPQAQTPPPTPASLARDYVKEAETVMLSLRKTDRFGNEIFDITTSKLRNILTLVNQIYNEVVLLTGEKLPQSLQDRIKYLRVRIVYEAGRDQRIVKEFVSKARLLAWIEDIGDSRLKFLEFSRYMEALVAYHRFYGGND